MTQANTFPSLPKSNIEAAALAAVETSVLDRIRDKQRASWNRFSTGWEKWDTLTLDSLANQGAAILNALPLAADAKVLDIASGTGEPSLSLAQRVPNGRVVASDLSSGMLSVLKRKAAALRVRNLSTVVADACALPFEDGSFDAVSCRLGFMFFPDMQRAAAEMFRVLRSGGSLATTVWGPAPNNPWITATVAAIKEHVEFPTPEPGAPGMFRCAAPGALAEVLSSVGFQVQVERSLPGTWSFESFDEYWELMNDVVAPVVAVLADKPAEVVERVRESVRARVEAIAPGANKVLESGAVLVHATRG